MKRPEYTDQKRRNNNDYYIVEREIPFLLHQTMNVGGAEILSSSSSLHDPHQGLHTQ